MNNTPNDRLTLREPVSVPDLLERDSLVRRTKQLRDDASQTKTDIEHWNRTHPNDKAFDTTFEDATIAWCDGRGKLPHR